MTIAAILERKGSKVIGVECDTSVREAVSLLAENRIGAMPVLKDGRVEGIISERDVVDCLSRTGAGILDAKVEQAMSAPAVTVTRDVPVLSALSLMSQRRMRHLPVVEEDQLIGIVSIGDLVQYRIDCVQQEADAMRSYIQGA